MEPETAIIKSLERLGAFDVAIRRHTDTPNALVVEFFVNDKTDPGFSSYQAYIEYDKSVSVFRLVSVSKDLPPTGLEGLLKLVENLKNYSGDGRG